MAKSLMSLCTLHSYVKQQEKLAANLGWVKNVKNKNNLVSHFHSQLHFRDRLMMMIGYLRKVLLKLTSI